MVTVSIRTWLLLVYKIPPDPTANRVAVWRRLKRLGAILLHDAVWVLPPSPRTREELQWLAADIRERGGEAMLWQASLCDDDDELVRQFLAQSERAYSDILDELERPDADLAALSKRYQQARVQDHFQSPLAERVRQTLLAVGGRAGKCDG